MLVPNAAELLSRFLFVCSQTALLQTLTLSAHYQFELMILGLSDIISVMHKVFIATAYCQEVVSISIIITVVFMMHCCLLSVASVLFFCHCIFRSRIYCSSDRLFYRRPCSLSTFSTAKFLYIDVFQLMGDGFIVHKRTTA